MYPVFTDTVVSLYLSIPNTTTTHSLVRLSSSSWLAVGNLRWLSVGQGKMVALASMPLLWVGCVMATSHGVVMVYASRESCYGAWSRKGSPFSHDLIYSVL